MKNILYIISLAFITLFLSCSPAYVASDYDRTVDFSQYKTFDFYSNIDWKNMNDFNQRRMLTAIEKELNQDGLQKSDNPDILIDILVDEKVVKRQTGSVGIGSGSYGRGVGVGMSVGIPISSQKLNKNYVIEMIDAKTENLIWQGVYEKDAAMHTDQDALIQEAMQKVFDKFPPQK